VLLRWPYWGLQHSQRTGSEKARHLHGQLALAELDLRRLLLLSKLTIAQPLLTPMNPNQSLRSEMVLTRIMRRLSK